MSTPLDLAPVKAPVLEISKLNIVPLNSPGPHSNYLDWSFIAEVNLEAANLDYVLTPIELKDRPLTWAANNKTVVSLLTQIVDHSNIRYMWGFCTDAAGMWKSLKDAHQDLSSGGRMYWLRKMVMTRLTNNDFDSHITQMQTIYDHLSALITTNNPLTADDVFATSLLISLPSD